jgi:hypothetical protein
MATFWRDLKQGLRLLWRKPGFAAVAIVTPRARHWRQHGHFHGCARAAAEAAALFRSRSNRRHQRKQPVAGWPSFSVAPPNFVDWRSSTQSFSRMAAYGNRSFNYSGGGGPERLRGLSGTEGFLEILDGTPEMGRGFVRMNSKSAKTTSSF